LNEKVTTELAALRKEARDAVAAEAKKLSAETAAQVAALRSAAKTELASEMQKLQAQLKAEIALVRTDATKEIASAIAQAKDAGKKAADDLKQSQVALQKNINDEIAKAQKSLNDEMQKAKEALQAEMKTAVEAASKNNEPAPAKPADNAPEAADVPKTVEVKSTSEEPKETP
jgi:hypothetical protein